MTTRRSIAETRRDLPALIREAEAGATVEISRHGRPVAVLLGREAFERLRDRDGAFGERWQRFRDRHDPSGLDLDVDRWIDPGADAS